MPNEDVEKHPWLRRRVQKALASGLERAYNTVKVDPQHFLDEIRRGHKLPVRSIEDMLLLPSATRDDLADQTIAASMKLGAMEGMGLGFGGVFTLVPDMGILAAIALRMVQKLSLIYGFEYATENEVAELWLAVGTAAGLDTVKEIVERQLVGRFVPKLIQRIAAKASAEVVEKWAARIVPIVSGVLGGALNYYFIKQWGRRAKKHYQDRHEASRRAVELGGAATVDSNLLR